MAFIGFWNQTSTSSSGTSTKGTASSPARDPPGRWFSKEASPTYQRTFNAAGTSTARVSVTCPVIFGLGTSSHTRFSTGTTANWEWNWRMETGSSTVTGRSIPHFDWTARRTIISWRWMVDSGVPCPMPWSYSTRWTSAPMIGGVISPPEPPPQWKSSAVSSTAGVGGSTDAHSLIWMAIRTSTKQLSFGLVGFRGSGNPHPGARAWWSDPLYAPRHKLRTMTKIKESFKDFIEGTRRFKWKVEL